jgi:hypothetical protein
MPQDFLDKLALSRSAPNVDLSLASSTQTQRPPIIPIGGHCAVGATHELSLQSGCSAVRPLRLGGAISSGCPASAASPPVQGAQ